MSSVSNQLQEKLAILMSKREVKKGLVLFREGELEENIFWVLEGKVKQTRTTVDGKELTLNVRQTGDIVGEMNLFEPTSTYISTAIAIEDGMIGVVSKKSLECLLSQDPNLMIEFTRYLSQINRRNQSKFSHLLLYGKQGALYSTLIRLSNSFGVEKPDGIFINLHLTNQELADFIGTARETLNRMVGELKKEKIISYEDGYITIHNIDFLRSFMECGECCACQI